MKAAAVPLSVALTVASGAAFAQSASDPIAHLRACSLMEHAERLECLENLSRNIAPPARAALGGDNWIVSETTSPVDYTPVVAASTFSRGGSDGSSMQLSIHCRAGRTELVVAGPAVRSGEDYAMTTGRCSWRQAHLVWNGRCLRGRRRPLVAVASRGGRLRPPSVDPSRCRPGRAFSARRAEDGARESSRGVQVATRRCQARQLMVIERSWERHDDEV